MAQEKHKLTTQMPFGFTKQDIIWLVLLVVLIVGLIPARCLVKNSGEDLAQEPSPIPPESTQSAKQPTDSTQNTLTPAFSPTPKEKTPTNLPTDAPPTLTMTPTIVPSFTPVPSDTPTSTDTPEPSPTSTATPTPSSPPPQTPTEVPWVTLESPSETETGACQIFRWRAEALPEGQFYEITFWKHDKDKEPMENGLGVAEASTDTEVEVNLWDLIDAGTIEPRIYFWGIRVVEKEPYKALYELGSARRRINAEGLTQEERCFWQ